MSSTSPKILPKPSHASDVDTESDKDEYEPQNSHYSTGSDSDDKVNNTVATIEELFLHIGHRSTYERLTEQRVQQTCQFFMHSPRRMTAKDRVPLRGIKSGLRPFQALGVFSMLQIETQTRSGGILADEMGYGKVSCLGFSQCMANIFQTLQCLAKFVCNRWLTVMHEDIVADRVSGHPRRHLPQNCDTSVNLKKIRCPSQSQWPIQCPCVPNSVSQQFRPVLGPALALVPAKLVKNWQAECMKLLDVVDVKLRLQISLGHRSATTEEKIGTERGRQMMTPEKLNPSADSTRFLVITSPTSYVNNVQYYLSTHEAGFVEVPGKKRKEFRFKSFTQDVWGQIFRDEYHEEKRRDTKGMTLCLAARRAHPDARVWFVSGTPWSTSPRDLDGVFSVLYIKKIWDNHARLDKAGPEAYGKLITRYEAILNRSASAASKSNDHEPVEAMAELLEVVMIRRTSDSKWFGKTMIDLPPHTRTEVSVEFPLNYRSALQEMEKLIKSSLKATMPKTDNPPKKPTLARFFERAYKVRAVTVFPALAALVLQQPSLDLTWGQFMDEGFLRDDQNPYLSYISLLMASSPKLDAIFAIVEGLGTMRFEFNNGVVSEVAEKLVIAATNPLVCYLIVKVG